MIPQMTVVADLMALSNSLLLALLELSLSLSLSLSLLLDDPVVIDASWITCARSFLEAHSQAAHRGKQEQQSLQQTLLPLAVHLKERLTVSQSVSRASRQADRQTARHNLGLFSDGLGYKQWGAAGIPGWSVVEWKCTQPPTVSSAVLLRAS